MAQFDYEVECPHCGAVFNAPRIRAGRREPCPVCRSLVLVEPADGPSAPEAWDGPVARAEPTAAPAALLTEAEGPVIVCVAGEQKVNPMAVGPLVAAFTGVSEAEGRRRVVRGEGLLAESLHADTAQNLLAALAEEGVDAFAVPVS
ncbi:MAG: hypothetical protein AMK73_06465, partial [Planctomycetes bacterium SM23_32]